MDKLPQLLLGCALLGLGYLGGLYSSTRAGSHTSLTELHHPLSAPPSFAYVRSAEELLSMDPLSRMVLSLPAWVFAAPAATPMEFGPPTPPTAEAQALMKAQDYEDKAAHLYYFAGVRGGLMIESGALNGVQFSVSNFFVRAQGWRAIHVEGSPSSFAELTANRPESLNIHSALCSRREPLHYALRNGKGGAASGFWEFMSDNIKRAYWGGGKEAELVLVPCRPLGPMLAMLGITHVDLWVLDVEGAELEVLQTVDFAKVSIDVITVEQDGGNKAKDEAVRALLLSKGYKLDKVLVRNDWFIREGFVPRPEAEAEKR
jgi:hypothetical protein